MKLVEVLKINLLLIAIVKTIVYCILTRILGFTYPCVRHWTSFVNGWLFKGISFSDGTNISYTVNQTFITVNRNCYKID